MKKRYLVRREYFGGIIYDRTTFENFYVNELAFNIISTLSTLGIDRTLKKYIDHEKYEYIKSYIQQLKDKEFYLDNNINLKILNNEIKGPYLLAPIKVYLTITEKCNLRCKHCFGDF
ncbi:MAG: hypothetical protein ACRCXT_00885 [Paraclostridium sp.]